MYKTKMKLEELFNPKSLRNLTTLGNGPMPHSGCTYYITADLTNEEIKKIVEQGNKWGYGGGSSSISSYIDLSEQAHEEISSRLIQYGPQSRSSSFKIQVHTAANDSEILLVTASGWGSSCIRLFEGPQSEFLGYLKQWQGRS